MVVYLDLRCSMLPLPVAYFVDVFHPRHLPWYMISIGLFTICVEVLLCTMWEEPEFAHLVIGFDGIVSTYAIIWYATSAFGVATGVWALAVWHLRPQPWHSDDSVAFENLGDSLITGWDIKSVL